MEKLATINVSMQKHYFPHREPLLSVIKLAALILAHTFINRILLDIKLCRTYILTYLNNYSSGGNLTDP